MPDNLDILVGWLVLNSSVLGRAPYCSMAATAQAERLRSSSVASTFVPAVRARNR
ncbi:uncharacterized protein METZ01_LOCUS384552 [marine metagenome]|uniref:Uncharacterized protein n=1 Tax=marine metagenome TaxID=408172 RepID=A0A382UDC6_9ZZZZ